MMKSKQTFVGKFMWTLEGRFSQVVSENTTSVTLVTGLKVPRKKINIQPKTGMLLELGEWKNQ